MMTIRPAWVGLAALAGRAIGVTLTVSTSGGNTSSSYLYGIMFEVIIKPMHVNLKVLYADCSFQDINNSGMRPCLILARPVAICECPHLILKATQNWII